MTVYGYARVSADGQTLDNQHAKLTAEGAEKIFSEKDSGAKTDRKALAKALAALEPGDVLLVTRLDRLASFCRETPGELTVDVSIRDVFWREFRRDFMKRPIDGAVVSPNYSG